MMQTPWKETGTVEVVESVPVQPQLEETVHPVEGPSLYRLNVTVLKVQNRHKIQFLKEKGQNYQSTVLKLS